MFGGISCSHTGKCTIPPSLPSPSASPKVLSICAMLSCGNSVFYRPKDHAVHADNARLNFARGGGGDHGTLMRVYSQWVETNYSTQVSYHAYVTAEAAHASHVICRCRC